MHDQQTIDLREETTTLLDEHERVLARLHDLRDAATDVYAWADDHALQLLGSGPATTQWRTPTRRWRRIAVA